MAIRTFKQFTIAAGGTPQPAVGSTILDPIGPVTNPDLSYTARVVDSSMFSQGIWGIIGKPSAGEERLFVLSVTDSTHILVKGALKKSYASGAYIRPSFPINSTFIQTVDGNSGAIYVGTTDAMVKGTFAFVVATLTNVVSGQPSQFMDGRSGLYNADDCAQWWIDGTTGDGYLPSFGQV
jgi:hypothetical protein